MGITELLMTAVALSMDAFAVAVCKGIATNKVKMKHMLICGAWFGGFQALMPLIGYFLGQTFESYIRPVDHWIAFFLLAVIGFNMLRESLECEEEADASLGFKIMLTMALATSIDALAVGITFAITSDLNIIFAIASIGVITFLLSALGVKIGSIFGARWRSPAEFIGGIVLIGIGLKILIQHMIEDKAEYDLVIATSAALLLAAIFIFLGVVNHKRVSKDCTQRSMCHLYGAFSVIISLTSLGLIVTTLVLL